MVVISPAGIVSGLIPFINVGNTQLSTLTTGVVQNAAYPLLGVAVSQVFGANFASSLGLNPNLTSSFLANTLSPGLITTGVSGLSQVIGTSISDSKALGPLGPLVGGLTQSVVSSLGTDLTNSLFGGAPASRASQYFPGGGGEAEGEYPADYSTVDSNGRKTVSTAYTLGNGGPDVIFSITSAQAAVKKEEELQKASAEAATGTGVAGSLDAARGSVPNAGDSTKSATAIGSVKFQEPGPNVPAAQVAGTPANLAAAGNAASAATATTLGTSAPAPNTQTPGTPPQTTQGETPSGVSWKFICPPEEISWETTAQSDRVQIFGANKAPVISGVKSMRELTLNNAVVEGFCRNKAVEDKVVFLEKLMDMALGPNNAYVQVPVYRVTANSKIYGQGGNDGGFFIIKSIRVQEKMRDLSGRTTRATVDISMTQVPPYQVDTGRDIASKFLASSKAPFSQLEENLLKQQKSLSAQAAQNVPAGGGGSTGGTTGGSNPPAQAPEKPAPRPTSSDPNRPPLF